MRKFLDFVVRDDRPVITPPSENEEEFFDDTNGRHEDIQIEIQTQDGGHNVKDIPAGAEITPEGIPLDVNQPSDGQGNTFSALTPAVNEISKQHIELFGTASSTAQTPSHGLPDSTAANANFDNDSKEKSQPYAVDDAERDNGEIETDLRHIQAIDTTTLDFRNSPSAVRDQLSRSDDRLRKATKILELFAAGAVHEEQKDAQDSQSIAVREVVSALREIAETMVWADQHEPNLWDTFMECAIMRLLLRCLRATISSEAKHPIANYKNPENTVTSQSIDDVSALNIRPGAEIDRDQVTHDLADESLPTVEPSNKGEAVQSLGESVSAANRDMEKDAQDANREHSDDSVSRQSFHAFALEIQSQVLQTLSIMIQSVFDQRSLLCLFSSNHINDILSFNFRFEDDEMLGYFMSAVKTIALKLDLDLLQLFFDSSCGLFPLYTNVIRFFNHQEQMVRIAVRNVTLTIYDLGDPDVLTFAARDESMYLHNTVELLAKLCGSVSRGIELLMDDGREVRRTRSRTGVFRQKVRRSDITTKLEEIENLLAYLGDVVSISDGALRPLVLRLVSSKLFAPFFRPLASRASPKAIQAQRRWRISKTAASHQTSALPVFDAGARCLLLTFVLHTCRSSSLGIELIRELSSRTPEFDDRTVLHGLKAMASDIAGTERISFVSLCAIEAIVSYDATPKQITRGFGYDFDRSNFVESLRTSGHSHDSLLHREYAGDVYNNESHEEPLLMTLSEFEAPLTPSNSLPSTPRYEPPSPSDGSTPQNSLSRVVSASSLSTEGIAYFEGSDSDVVLSTFQFGEATLREVLLSVIVVVRRREIRTMRVLCAICRILSAVGAATNNFDSCVDVAKAILDEIAGFIQSFLRDKRTTIVCIERMFESFRSVGEQDFSRPEGWPTLEEILRPEVIPNTAAELPPGASKRRKALYDDISPPTEREDAAALFVMIHTYENLIDQHLKNAASREDNVPRDTRPVLSAQVKDILSSCDPTESYLEKREVLLEVSGLILRRQEIRETPR